MTTRVATSKLREESLAWEMAIKKCFGVEREIFKILAAGSSMDVLVEL